MQNAAGKAKTPHDFWEIPISAGGRKKAPFWVRGSNFGRKEFPGIYGCGSKSVPKMAPR